MSRELQVHHTPLWLQKKMLYAYMYPCVHLCRSVCACTCVMNDLHLMAVSIFFLLIIQLALHGPLCAGARGFGADCVKSVSMLLTCSLAWESPQASFHVNQDGYVFASHDPCRAPTLVHMSYNLTPHLQECGFSVAYDLFKAPLNNIFILTMDQRLWKALLAVTKRILTNSVALLNFLASHCLVFMGHLLYDSVRRWPLTIKGIMMLLFAHCMSSNC